MPSVIPSHRVYYCIVARYSVVRSQRAAALPFFRMVILLSRFDSQTNVDEWSRHRHMNSHQIALLHATSISPSTDDHHRHTAFPSTRFRRLTIFHFTFRRHSSPDAVTSTEEIFPRPHRFHQPPATEFLFASHYAFRFRLSLHFIFHCWLPRHVIFHAISFDYW